MSTTPTPRFHLTDDLRARMLRGESVPGLRRCQLETHSSSFMGERTDRHDYITHYIAPDFTEPFMQSDVAGLQLIPFAPSRIWDPALFRSPERTPFCEPASHRSTYVFRDHPWQWDAVAS